MRFPPNHPISSMPIPGRPASRSFWPARGPCFPGGDDVYNAQTGAWDKLASGPNYAPNCAYLGWGMYVMARVNSDPKKHKAAWSAAAHLGGKDLSLWTVMYPSGFQVHRTSHSNVE